MKNSEKGQGLIEYALILVLISIVVIVVLRLLGPQIATEFQRINDRLTTPTATVTSIEQTPAPDQLGGGMSVSQLFDQYYGSYENYANAWTEPVTFEFPEKYIEGSGALNVAVNGSLKLLLDDGKNAKVFYQDLNENGRIVTVDETNLFSSELYEAVAKHEAYYGMPMKESDGKVAIVLVPVEIMPKVVSDISSWNDTKTSIYLWSAYGDWNSQIVQNLGTGEIYIGTFGVDLYGDDHTFDSLQRGSWIWGYVHIEKNTQNYPYVINISQSQPDVQVLWQAEEYARTIWTGSVLAGPAEACWKIKELVSDSAGLSKYEELCDVYYVK